MSDAGSLRPLERMARFDPVTVPRRHFMAEAHRTERLGWLRAAVLGANDGIVSTGALLVGIAGSGADRTALLTAGIAGLVAGAASMGIGEFVSVSSQADVEHAERAKEQREIETDPGAETTELRLIYERRGLDRNLAQQVAESLMAHDPLGAHLRDELGLTREMRARPVSAAWWSFASFAAGALIPLLAAVATPDDGPRAVIIAVATLVACVSLGVIAARIGGSNPWRGALRTGIGGGIALAITYLVGALVGTAIG